MPQLVDRIRDSFDTASAAEHRSRLPAWVGMLGSVTWAFVGATLSLLIIAAFIAASSSISVPLILAVVIACVTVPAVDRLAGRGASRIIAAVAVLVGIAAAGAFTVWLAVRGIAAQAPMIWAQVERGAATLGGWLGEFGLDRAGLIELVSVSREAVAGDSVLVDGLVAPAMRALTTGFSSAFALLFGMVISGALLVYILRDFHQIVEWVGARVGLPAPLGGQVVLDGVDSVQAYFRATTISGFVVAVVIGVTVALLGVPLAVPIALVTFLTCYIPFFGAIFSGAFACLVALGQGGLAKALVVLVVVLVAQNVLQTVMNANMMGDSLRLSPVVVLVVTMLGGIFGGLLGAALAAPTTAFLIRATNRFREAAEDSLP